MDENSKDDCTTNKIIKEEDIELGSVKLSVLIDFIRKNSVMVTTLFFLCYLLYNVVQIINGIWLSIWTSESVLANSSNNTNNQDIRLSVYIALSSTQQIFSLTAELFSVRMLMRSSSIYHEAMLHNILRSKMNFFEKTPIGRILNRFSKDLSSIEFALPISFKDILICVFDIASIAFLVSYATPLFLCTFLPLFLLYLACQMKRLEVAKRTPIFSFFAETLSGIHTIKAFRQEEKFTHSLNNRVDINNSFNYPIYISQRWICLRLECIGGLVAFFACIFAIISRNSLSPGLAGLSIAYALNMSIFLNQIVKMIAEFDSNLTSVERIKDYCNIPPESEWINEDKRPDKGWPKKGHLKFINYSIKYREDLDCVLKNLNFEIMPGEKIGIVGRTGAGKSSLTLGLLRILEAYSGEIIIDGVGIKNIGLHDLRQNITIIPQDPFLYSGSIRENLDPFNKYEDNEIWYCLEKSYLKDIVKNLKDGLLHQVSENGENFSVGQRQLFCLARALLRKTKILLLDEATAAIDHHTDHLVQKTIKNVFKTTTVLTIAHRLNTVLDSTRILVLSNGEIIEFDTPMNLYKNHKTVFHSMVDAACIDEKTFHKLSKGF